MSSRFLRRKLYECANLYKTFTLTVIVDSIPCISLSSSPMRNSTLSILYSRMSTPEFVTLRLFYLFYCFLLDQIEIIDASLKSTS